MPTFEYHEPTTLEVTLDLAARFGEGGRFLAGGTDLIIQMRRGRLAPAHVVSLDRVPGLADVAVNGAVTIGACVTHRALERHPAFQRELRGIVEGAQVIGGHQVRNVATVGGNVVNASPAADLVPPLLTVDASATLLSDAGVRTVALDEFFVGPGSTVRRPEELLVAVSAPALPPRSATAFLKAGRRRAMEISVVCVAVRLTLDADLSRCRVVRIAVGACGPTVVRARAAEASLEGCAAEASAFARAGALAVEACAPISDVRASAAFRKRLVATLVPRALEIAVRRARGREGHPV